MPGAHSVAMLRFLRLPDTRIVMTCGAKYLSSESKKDSLEYSPRCCPAFSFGHKYIHPSATPKGYRPSVSCLTVCHLARFAWWLGFDSARGRSRTRTPILQSSGTPTCLIDPTSLSTFPLCRDCNRECLHHAARWFIHFRLG